MSSQEGNEGCQSNNHEEWQAGNSRDMPDVWDKNVSNRKKLNLQLRQRLTERLDVGRDAQPFYCSHTIWTNVQ